VLTVVGSLKSPGVTTTALALGYARGATVVEADPAGGDVAGWFGWADVGLSALAAAARRQVRAELLSEHAEQTPYGLAVVPARSTPDGAAGSVAAVVEVLPKLATDTDLVVDVGRLSEITERLVPQADEVVLQVHPLVGELARLARRLDVLRSWCGPRLKVVLYGPSPYGESEVSAALGCPITATIPYDWHTAGLLRGVPGRLPPPGAYTRRWWQVRRWRLLEAVTRW
jgi:hypothetical protein